MASLTRISRSSLTLFCLAAMLAAPSLAAPGYDAGPQELQWVLQRLIDWLPGGWSSAPQLEYERTVRAPVEGEHEDWYRSFALIKAPQVGDIVFYGQVNLGGPDGPLLPGSQVLYKTWIDEKRGVVVINGRGPADPDKFVDLQRHPELWPVVTMREAETIRCDFIWRRQGQQIFGVLEGKTEEMRKYGPGSCNYISTRTNAEFRADAEWVLSPEEFWLYDLNLMGGRIFQGRADHTHTRLYRARDYRCTLQDANTRRSVPAYDRGFGGDVSARDAQKLRWRLLRAEYPSGDANGLVDRLRLTLSGGTTEKPVVLATADAAPLAARIGLRAKAQAVSIDCERAATK
jgi:hypothetical protein